MTSNPQYLEVAVPTPLRRSFHYLPPSKTNIDRLVTGLRVKVPFGRQKLVGILLGTTRDPGVASDKIRSAIEIIDDQPVLPATLMTLCTWSADYYHHPVGDVMSAALPRLLRQGEPRSELQALLVPVEGARGGDLTRAPAQAGLLRKLQGAGSGLSVTELKRLDISRSVINGLIGKGLAAWQTHTEVPRHFDPDTVQVNTPDIELYDEQRQAVAAIDRPGVWLLYGITGSGKTEVYLRLIEDMLRAGKQSLVLVPEIGLTPQLVARFTRRFSVRIEVIHSGLTDRERLSAWRAAECGAAGIVIGTRSAIFTPLASPGLLVVDEEHDSSFKQQDGFRYSARDLAIMRGRLEGVPVILGSATPSLETLHNVDLGKYQRLDLSRRPGDAEPARYRVMNIRNEKLDEGFSPHLIELVREHLNEGNQVLVFLNRRGFAPVLLCHECGWIARCRRCDARLTYHHGRRKLICHHCGSTNTLQPNCPECASNQLVPLGAGTERLEQTLSRLLPGNKIVRIDGDTTRKKDYMEKVLQEVRGGEPAVLIGTQLLAKGHHFPDVTLAAIVDVDSGFYSADFKAIEKMGQLILQVGGRSGRASKRGLVAIQTHFPGDPMLRTLIQDGYIAFAQKILQERREYELPPWHHMTLFRAESVSKTLPLTFLTEITDKTASSDTVNVLGPVPSPMEKRAGKYRAQLLLSSPNRKALRTQVKQCIEIAENAPAAHKVRWSVDVDPVDLF